MTDNIIKLNDNDNILRFTLVDKDGEKTGEVLEFDLGDVELPLRYQEMLEKNKKNKQWITNQLKIIDGRQDVKGKKLFSKNQEDKIQAINDFYKKEEEVYDMFLGQGGVKKILNGRKLHWTAFNEIDDIITTYITPKFDYSMQTIIDGIKDKYKIEPTEEENVLE